MTKTPLLKLDDLCVETKDPVTSPQVVSNVNLHVDRGEVLGVVGESGSGKSLTIRSCLQLLPRNLSAQGTVTFNGQNVLALRGRDLAQYRARNVALIHQDPRSCINPTRTIRQFVTEGVVHSGLMSAEEAYISARQLIRDVGIADPERRMAQFPFELSGGLLQRMMIVAALLPNPTLIFADEPTTALDVTVQSDVMAILMEQVQLRQASMLMVTHDLDLAAAVSDRLSVMHAGHVVESGPTATVCANPQDPYTADLLNARASFTGWSSDKESNS